MAGSQLLLFPVSWTLPHSCLREGNHSWLHSPRHRQRQSNSCLTLRRTPVPEIGRSDFLFPLQSRKWPVGERVSSCNRCWLCTHTVIRLIQVLNLKSGRILMRIICNYFLNPVALKDHCLKLWSQVAPGHKFYTTGLECYT